MGSNICPWKTATSEFDLIDFKRLSQKSAVGSVNPEILKEREHDLLAHCNKTVRSIYDKKGEFVPKISKSANIHENIS